MQTPNRSTLTGRVMAVRDRDGCRSGPPRFVQLRSQMMDHETEPVERWPDDVLSDDHPTPSVERWPDDALTDDHPTEPIS
jgi:hypothetical protein